LTGSLAIDEDFNRRALTQQSIVVHLKRV
jgi:hypothetical protein